MFVLNAEERLPLRARGHGGSRGARSTAGAAMKQSRAATPRMSSCWWAAGCAGATSPATACWDAAADSRRRSCVLPAQMWVRHPMRCSVREQGEVGRGARSAPADAPLLNGRLWVLCSGGSESQGANGESRASGPDREVRFTLGRELDSGQLLSRWIAVVDVCEVSRDRRLHRGLRRVVGKRSHQV